MSNDQPPVDQRVLGLDRRKLWPTLGILALVLLWGVLVPALDDAVDGEPVQAGDTYDLRYDVTFEPAPGWLVEGAPMPASPTLRLFADGVSFEISAGAYEGTPEELLDDVVELRRGVEVAGGTQMLSTRSGVSGAAVETTGAVEASALFAFVTEREKAVSGAPELVDPGSVGVEVVVEGPVGTLEDRSDEIGEMVASITQQTPSGEEEAP